MQAYMPFEVSNPESSVQDEDVEPMAPERKRMASWWKRMEYLQMDGGYFTQSRGEHLSFLQPVLILYRK